MPAVLGVVAVEEHEEGRHHEEEHVGGGVDELGNVRGEGVVVLAPVDGAGAALQVSPHLPGSLTPGDLTSHALIFITTFLIQHFRSI